MLRRQYLRRAAATATATVGVTTTAAARFDGQPSDVSLSFDRGRLRQYRPLLDTTSVEAPINDPPVYAWVAESDLRDTDVLCYWAWYLYQDGLTEADSHVPDREPVYVFVADDGAVDRVVYDGWHYLAATDRSPRLLDETHPWLFVVGPWQPYRRPTVNETTDTAQFPEVRSFKDQYRAWKDAGWAVDPVAALNPWTIEQKGNWWGQDLGAQFGRLRARASLAAAQAGLDLRLGEESDLVG